MTQNESASLAAEANLDTEQQAISDFAQIGHQQHLQEREDQLGLRFGSGTIVRAGQSKTGSALVQFNDTT